MKKGKDKVKVEKAITSFLADDEMIDSLDERVEEEELLEEADDLDPDDPMNKERLMRIKNNRSQLSSVW